MYLTGTCVGLPRLILLCAWRAVAWDLMPWVEVEMSMHWRRRRRWPSRCEHGRLRCHAVYAVLYRFRLVIDDVRMRTLLAIDISAKGW